jgi:hypothetical protein
VERLWGAKGALCGNTGSRDSVWTVSVAGSERSGLMGGVNHSRACRDGSCRVRVPGTIGGWGYEDPS